MLPGRIEKQLEESKKHPDAIVGSMFLRIPMNATARYTQWANQLTAEQLYSQQYRECTIIQPTWFMTRSVYEKAGPYFEGTAQRGRAPEDLMLFYRHLKGGGELRRVDQLLLLYRYHPDAASFGVHRDDIFAVRVAHLQTQVLDNWPSFTIWSAGKEGRHFYNALLPANKAKVVGFCDVDAKKIARGYNWDPHLRRRLPIFHFSHAVAPIVTCVKLDLTDGEFEANLASLKLREGIDFFYFA